MNYVRAPLPDRRQNAGRRVMAVAGVVMAGFLLIIGQLWYLQVLEGGHFRDASDKNRIRVRPVAAPRGILYDRNGLPLVDNRPAFTLSLIPRELPREGQGRDAVLGRVAALLHIPYEELEEAARSSDSYLPVRVRRGLSLEAMAKIEEWKLELPGVIVEVEPQRTYPTSRFAAHLLGYVREASEEQLRGGRYRRGDMVGQNGLERLLDEYLRGRDGGERIEVDALGRPVRVIKHTDPNPGAEVITTVDRRIQEAAEAAMEGKAGAVVVMDPRNGDVLAMVSTPAYEIDRFTGTIDRAAWMRLVKHPDHPLLNRTLQSQYAPGSIFKIIVAAAGLQERVLAPSDQVYCTGDFQLGNRTFRDWKYEGHGWVDLKDAITYSCNVYFYQAGLKIGGAAISRYARMFGLGQPTGIDLGPERSGLIPGPTPRRTGRPVWLPGDVVNMSIGQGQLLVTPMQVARFMAAVANGGVLWKPRLVQRVERPDRGVLYADPGQVTGHVPLAPAIWAYLRQALWSVINDGTGGGARIPGLDVAGKTGTAQMSGSPRGQDHAWFAAFAPVRDPEVVVVVVVERGGRGGQVAAPIAAAILRAIFFERVAALEILG